LLAQSDKHPIEEVGARSRSLMPWVQKKNIKGAQAAYYEVGILMTTRVSWLAQHLWTE